MTTATADTFDSLGLDGRLTAVLAQLGYEEPTPVQSRAIPALLGGRDVLGQAATGTGKTAAFALPLLQRLFAGSPARGTVVALVLVPTRELAMQVAEAVHRYGRPLKVAVLPIYGGQAMGLQLRALKRGVDVVVATPGRALDHLQRGTLDLSGIRAVVLDEADEMLDMGFAEDLEAILDGVPEERQTALFSATMPPRIAAIARRHLREPEQVKIAEEVTPRGEAPRVRQVAYLVSRAQKVDALGRVLDIEAPSSALVFCRTRTEVDELAQTLGARGYRAEALHGGLNQSQRDRVMKRLREGTADLLLATDVAARGLDIGHLSHVVNFDVPSSPEVYVHRIGRTGRAGREGTAITLVEARERPLLRNIERLTHRKIELSPVPTVADLRARRLEMTRASLREALLRGGADGARVVVEALAGEFDVLQVAIAAVHLLQEATERDGAGTRTGGARAEPPREPARAEPAAYSTEAVGEAGEKPRRARPAPDERPAGEERPSRPPRAERPPRRAPSGSFVKIYVSAGRSGGVRPGDLVGAITGEAGVAGEVIGSIEIADRFSLVEVLESEAEGIVGALQNTSIRGKRVTASRYRDPRERKGKQKP